ISPVAGEFISQQNFKLKLRIAEKLKEQAYVDSEPLQQLRQQYLDELHHQVISLNRDNFSVRRQLSYVDQYSNREVWDDLSQTAVATIERELSHLPVVIDNNEMAKRFDVLIHRLQLAHLEKSKIKESLSNQVISIAQGLSKKMNIPAIAQKKKKIHKLLTNEYWKDLQVDNLEEVREELRSLVEALK